MNKVTMAPVKLFCQIILVIVGVLGQEDGLVFPEREGLVYARLNSDAILPCDLAFPFDEDFLTLMWFKGSVLLLSKGKDGQVVYSYPDLQNEYTMNVRDHSLTVISVQTADTANYTCEKSFTKLNTGKLMKENKTVELIVQDTPSPPFMPISDRVTSTTAFISWKRSNTDNNSPITNYLIYLKKNDDAWEDSKVILVDGKTLQITLRELIPYTAYQVRVVAKNALGNSEPSTESSIFVTEPEVPSVAPSGLNYTSPTERKIDLKWIPPPPDSVNGVVKGYIIIYEKMGSGEKFELTLQDPSAKSATLDKLEPFTKYSVTVMMFNDVGNSPPAIINVTTAEGPPDTPRLLLCTDMKSTSFTVVWKAPREYNGKLKNYQLQWMREDNIKTRIVTGHLTDTMSAKISNLEPHTMYRLRVRAETGGGYSNFSQNCTALTDVAGPSRPKVNNFTVIGPDTIYVQWDVPRIYFNDIDSYFIQYWTVDGSVRGEEVAEGQKYKKLITGLETNNEYKLKIAGVTKSLYSQAYYIGNFSEEISFKLEDPTIVPQAATEVAPAGMIAGIIVAVLFLSAVLLLFVCYKSVICRKFPRSLYYFTVPTNSQSPQSTVVFPPEAVEDTKYHEIDISNFLYHVRQMHADSDNGFSIEFEEIGKSSKGDANGVEIPSEASARPENKNKNRYVNITAYDHTRVILQQSPGKPKSSDYINANFIDGYMKPNAYIATQGPLPHTFADFWQMVWEQGSIVIIMITNLVERGRRKCDLYWPEEGSETYGSVTVKHINTFSRAHYTVRMFSLKSSKNKKKHVSERIVYQYHYTEWPDHGVPEFTLPVLNFVLKSSKENNPPGAGPIIIHCSAGVGRTGTYMLIETMIRQIEDKRTVNIPAFLLHIRQQRRYLVQTEEQYMLIHDAVAEYILTKGETEIKSIDLSKFLSEFTRQINGEITHFQIQYNLVTNFSPKPDDKFHALKGVNVCKNRTLDMVPLSVKRVLLPMKPGVEGSDYINATYLHGYNKSNEFIITQHPLEQTFEDFWRMIWDQNTCVIVLLSDIDEEEFKSFWPAKDNPVDIGCFKLTYREEDERKKYNIKEFLLQSTQDDYVLMTRMIAPNMKWPESCRPIHHVFDLIDEVQTLHKQNDTGAVVVVDRFGGTEAATFCALWTIYDQMQHDKSVNIYQLAKLYHLKRAGVIGSKENYLFLFQAADSLLKEWNERDKQASPASIRLHLGSMKKNGTFPKSVTINSKPESHVPRSQTINSRMETPVLTSDAINSKLDSFSPENGSVNSKEENSIPRSNSTNSKTETNV